MTYKHIQRSIQKTRRNGFAKRTMRSYHGLSGVAVPVFDERRYPIASLCVVSEARHMNSAYVVHITQKLKHEAAMISKIYESERLQQQQNEKWRTAVFFNTGVYGQASG